MKEKSDNEFIRVFKDLHDHLLARGVKSAYMTLYNEASTDFQREIDSKGIRFQLAPPGINCRNAAEREISTFKGHFISGIW